MVEFLWLLLFSAVVRAQYSPQSYPDPRLDPASCKTLFPGQVCDPAEILTPEQRNQLNEKIQNLQRITSNIRNTSPPCVNSHHSNLYIMIALIDKLGMLPFESVSVEKFTNLLRSRYMNYQDVGLCDTMVLIVNSRQDRQVFTVAGRDAKLSREVLQDAFHKNLVHFRSGNYGTGLEGMVEQIVGAYNLAHIIQVPQPNFSEGSFQQLPSTSSGSGHFVHGVPQKVDVKTEKFNFDEVKEEDQLWIQLLIKAIGRCGYNQAKVTEYVRGTVEEAMALSLKLISDPRYNKIEEEAQDISLGPNARDRAWQNATFIQELYDRHSGAFPRRASQCPVSDNSKRL
uniref:Secreted protein n=1 Tax=Bursaphelenchus xylophilus TaxID=6326 RepID=A0A1I7SVT1_BURXY